MDHEREFIPLHVAIVDVSSGADEVSRVIGERLAAAGHEIVARERVADSAAAVRARLSGWVSDPDVDVVFAVAGADSNAVSEALAPLVTKTMPGFADLFRVLAYEDMKTSAMLVDIDAAQCESTFVFVLPPSVGAVTTALERLVVDQLDHRTTPTNLVMRLPRARSGVPVAAMDVPKTMPLPTSLRRPGPPPMPSVAPKPPATRVQPPKLVAVPSAPTSTTSAAKPAAAPKLVAVPKVADERATPAAKPATPPAPAAPPKLVAVPNVPPAKPTPKAEPAAPAGTGRDAARAFLSEPPSPAASGSFVDAAPDVVEERSAGASDPGHASAILRSLESPTPPRKKPPTEPPPHLVPDSPIDLPEPRSVVEPRKRTVSDRKPPADAPPHGEEQPRRPTRNTRRVAPLPIYRGRRSRVPLVLAVIAILAVIGATAAVIVTRRRDHARGPSDAPALAVAPADAQVAVVVPPPAPVDAAASTTPVDAADVVEMDPPSADAGTRAPPTPPTNPTNPTNPTRRPPTPPRVPPTVSPDAGVAVVAPPTPPADAAAPPPPPTNDCDESTCVANGYDQPCCARYKPNESFRPRPTGGLPDELDKAMVQRGAAKVKAFVDQCGEQHPAKGVVMLAVRVDGDGKVIEVLVASTPDDALGACCAAAMKRATFAKTANGGSFRYPYRF
jgi:molybdenum cofactor biosynthesis protein B